MKNERVKSERRMGGSEGMEQKNASDLKISCVSNVVYSDVTCGLNERHVRFIQNVT